ncbi:MAG: hypothetical protein ACRCWF_10285 [Beijerinckiaceae bacterium]
MAGLWRFALSLTGKTVRLMQLLQTDLLNTSFAAKGFLQVQIQARERHSKVIWPSH